MGLDASPAMRQFGLVSFVMTTVDQGLESGFDRRKLEARHPPSTHTYTHRLTSHRYLCGRSKRDYQKSSLFYELHLFKTASAIRFSGLIDKCLNNILLLRRSFERKKYNSFWKKYSALFVVPNLYFCINKNTSFSISRLKVKIKQLCKTFDLYTEPHNNSNQLMKAESAINIRDLNVALSLNGNPS